MSVALTVSGNEITDATRATNTAGDGFSGDSSYGVWEATTNLVTNGGFETNTTGWNNVSITSLTRVTSQFKFGTASGEVVTSNAAANEGAYHNFTATVAVYTVSAWVLGAGGGTVRMAVRDNAGANPQTGSAVTLTSSWQRITLTTTNLTAATWRCYVETDSQQNITFQVDGVQAELQPLATPYVQTDGGTAARSTGRVRFPISGMFTATQGWVAVRMRMEYACTFASINPALFAWGDSSADFIRVIFADSTNKFQIWRRAASSADPTLAQGSWAAKDIVTVVAYWTASGTGISKDGAAFITNADAHIPTPAATTADIATDQGIFAGDDARISDSEVLWFACGSGTLSDADAATIHANGNTDPMLDALPGTATLVWSADTATANRSPANTVAPVASGTATVGSVLSCTTGTWTTDATITYTYQWERDTAGNLSFSSIGSAIASTYTLVDADDGNKIRCVVTATSVLAAVTANSNALGLVAEPGVPTNTVAPVVTGTGNPGQTLTSGTGTWLLMGGVTHTYQYQWQRDDSGGETYGDIVGSTSSTYLLDSADGDCNVRCVVYATNDVGQSTGANSNATLVGPAVTVESAIAVATTLAAPITVYSNAAATDPNRNPPFASIDAAGNVKIDSAAKLQANRFVPAKTGTLASYYIKVKSTASDGASYAGGTGGSMLAQLVRETGAHAPDLTSVVASINVGAMSVANPATSQNGVKIDFAAPVQKGVPLWVVISNNDGAPGTNYFSQNYGYVTPGMWGANASNQTDGSSPNLYYGLDPREIVAGSGNGGSTWNIPGDAVSGGVLTKHVPTYIAKYGDNSFQAQPYYSATSPADATYTMVYQGFQNGWTLSQVLAFAKSGGNPGYSPVGILVNDVLHETVHLSGGPGFLRADLVTPKAILATDVLKLTVTTKTTGGNTGLPLLQQYADTYFETILTLGTGYPFYLSGTALRVLPVMPLGAAYPFGPFGAVLSLGNVGAITAAIL